MNGASNCIDGSHLHSADMKENEMGAVCQIALDIPPEVIDGLAAGYDAKRQHRA